LVPIPNLIDTGIPLPGRSDDSYDVLGTYQVVSNKNEMKNVPKNGDEFLGLLLSRHMRLLSTNPMKVNTLYLINLATF